MSQHTSGLSNIQFVLTLLCLTSLGIVFALSFDDSYDRNSTEALERRNTAIIAFSIISAACILSYAVLEIAKANLRIHFLRHDTKKETPKIIKSATESSKISEL
jgi:hypothetical protein